MLTCGSSHDTVRRYMVPAKVSLILDPETRTALSAFMEEQNLPMSAALRLLVSQSLSRHVSGSPTPEFVATREAYRAAKARAREALERALSSMEAE